LLVERAGLDPADFADQMDTRKWPELKRRVEAVFMSRDRDEWCQLMEGTDVCFAPVLDFGEAPQHPHNRARKTYIEVGGVTQPAPAPRFSRTAPEVRHAPHELGADTATVLEDWGVAPVTPG